MKNLLQKAPFYYYYYYYSGCIDIIFFRQMFSDNKISNLLNENIYLAQFTLLAALAVISC